MLFGFKKRILPNLATHENRWWALVVIALGLAIVIIDNTVLNVSIPYMLRDLNTQLPAIQWVISGYSLTIATVLITIGRLGDMWGRKRMFILGMIVFAVGSFIGSVAPEVGLLIFSRGVIQAVGAAMTLTSALALLASEFQGRERAIAFGIWGAIAGASASVGPLLGGFLTTNFSWRWSLRINVFIVAAALLGSVFIIEKKTDAKHDFDWWGMLLSGLGLFCLVFGFIQGRYYGWWRPLNEFTMFGLTWPLAWVSIIPFFFLISVILLSLFIIRERGLEKKGRAPLLKMSLFSSRGFNVGMLTLGVLAFGQFGVFFILPIFLENVLSLDALQAGYTLLFSSLVLLCAGFFSGFIARWVNIKWIVVTGMICLSAGALLLVGSLHTAATTLSIGLPLMLYGLGFGLSSAQLNNIIISSARLSDAGEASAASVTMRQIGASIGVAVIGAVLAAAFVTNATAIITSDKTLPGGLKAAVIRNIGGVNFDSGRLELPPHTAQGNAGILKKDIKTAIAVSTRSALEIGLIFIFIATAIVIFLMPRFKARDG
jgi:EmrB/QacA subfamily drug resistance transporter